MPTAKVVDEYYRIAVDIGSGATMRGENREGRFTSISEAVEAAMRITLDRKLTCDVERITVHEPINNIFGGVQTEAITGSVTIPGPQSFRYDPELSRYHPVNGWDVPAEIEVFALTDS